MSQRWVQSFLMKINTPSDASEAFLFGSHCRRALPVPLDQQFFADGRERDGASGPSGDASRTGKRFFVVAGKIRNPPVFVSLHDETHESHFFWQFLPGFFWDRVYSMKPIFCCELHNKSYKTLVTQG